MLIVRKNALLSGGAKLPYARQVEYLRNTGLVQYINTGILGGPGLRVVAEITPQQKTNDKWAIGSINTNARIYVAYQYGGSGNSGGRWGGGYGTFFSGTSSTAFGIGVKTSLDVEFTDDYQILKIDGEEKARFAKSGFTGNVTNPLRLFGLNNNNSTTYAFLCDIGIVKIYTDGTLVRDFIPVIDRNGVACMYDKVSGNLFYNAGTGTFLTNEDATS